MRRRLSLILMNAVFPNRDILFPWTAIALPLICGVLFAPFVVADPALASTQEEVQPRSTLAVMAAGVAATEDAPFVTSDYKFLPGDYVYFSFQIAGFAIASFERNEIHKVSLKYAVVPQDSDGVPLTEPATGSIQEEVNAEDKNWTPKRRASFLLPSYLASGTFRVHVTVYDLYGKTEQSKDFPFHIGGVEITPSASVDVQHFRFLRREDDREPLDIPAYSPGDTVFARFDMAGFKLGAGNSYALEYGVSVIQPNGKMFLDAPHAAELKASSFYPAQFLPGTLRITIPPNSVKGGYVLKLTVHDLIGNKSYETVKSFSIE
jgi:hypothetical protein